MDFNSTYRDQRQLIEEVTFAEFCSKSPGVRGANSDRQNTQKDLKTRKIHFVQQGSWWIAAPFIELGLNTV